VRSARWHDLAVLPEAAAALGRLGGMWRGACPLFLALSCACACAGGGGAGSRPQASASVTATPRPPAPQQAAAFDEVLRPLERDRAALATAYGSAGKRERAALRQRARERVVAAIVRDIFPRWYGTPWAFEGTAARPGEAPVACGYFVAAALENAGLRLSRRRFGQAGALAIQRALTPRESDLQRFFSIPADDLERGIRALGDGLYVIGLDVHVGFVVVDGHDVRLVHASYTGARVVLSEPLAAAQAIDNSRPSGYFVTPLFRDDRLIEMWLSRDTVPPP
jgi:hypothetical protein